jgi:hypothetical protein
MSKLDLTEQHARERVGFGGRVPISISRDDICGHTDHHVLCLLGGLMSYHPDQIDQWRGAATYVDRILRGEKPADLPVQAPTKYELGCSAAGDTAHPPLANPG